SSSTLRRRSRARAKSRSRPARWRTKSSFEFQTRGKASRRRTSPNCSTRSSQRNPSVRARGWGCRFLTGLSSDTTGALRSKVRWAPEPRLASTCPSTANRMSEPTLLLVDDEQPVLNALIRLLRKEPFRVLTAASADEALQILDKEEVQVVISDFRMPGKSGIELLREVKQRYPATVRCVMSGYANGHVIMDSINVGEVYRFLPKPWEDDDVIATVRECFRHHRHASGVEGPVAQIRAQYEELRAINELLERTVERRAQTLQLSQDVLDKL